MLKKISRWLWHLIWTLLKLLLRRPLLATSVIPLLPDGRLVLIRRRDNGLWGLPGGLVDWGENIEAAAKRELVEETGLVLVSVERLVGVYSGVKRDERFHNTCVAIEAKVEGTMSIADPDEVLDIKAFHKNELPTERLAHDHNQQLDDYFAGRTVIA